MFPETRQVFMTWKGRKGLRAWGYEIRMTQNRSWKITSKGLPSPDWDSGWWWSHGLAREEPITHIDLKPSLLQSKADTWYPCANPVCAIAHLWACAISAIRWQFICKCPSSQMCLHLICECTGISFQREFLHFHNLPFDNWMQGSHSASQGCWALLEQSWGQDTALSWAGPFPCVVPGKQSPGRVACALHELLAVPGWERAAVPSPGGSLPDSSTEGQEQLQQLPQRCHGWTQGPSGTHLMEVWTPISQSLGQIWALVLYKNSNWVLKLGALHRAHWPWLS